MLSLNTRRISRVCQENYRHFQAFGMLYPFHLYFQFRCRSKDTFRDIRWTFRVGRDHGKRSQGRSKGLLLLLYFRFLWRFFNASSVLSTPSIFKSFWSIRLKIKILILLILPKFAKTLTTCLLKRFHGVENRMTLYEDLYGA